MNVYNRRSFKLKKKRVVNTSDMWIKKEAAFDPVIPPEQFFRDQQIIQARSRHLHRRLKCSSGSATFSNVMALPPGPEMPSSSAYRSRFNTLTRTYTLVGFTPNRDFAFIELNRALRRTHAEHCETLLNKLREDGASVR
jgi:hypothetical protein